MIYFFKKLFRNRIFKKGTSNKISRVFCFDKKNILAENQGLDGFEYSDIIDQLILIHGREKYFPFKKDLNNFCAQAYFSNRKVLDAYNLSLNINQIKEFLGQEDDNLLFSKLINK